MTMNNAAFARHDLVWIDSVRWPAASRIALPATDMSLTADWFAAGRPAIVRRDPDAAPDTVAIGIPLSPTHGRRRLALAVSVDAIRAREPLPLLSAVIARAPRGWRAPLRKLDASTQALGLHLRIYGSLLWQHLTDEDYVTPQSDIDILFDIASGDLLEHALALLCSWEKQTGLRLDGELTLKNGASVAWRELLRTPEHVLLKDTHGVSLLPLSAVLTEIGSRSP